MRTDRGELDNIVTELVTVLGQAPRQSRKGLKRSNELLEQLPINGPIATNQLTVVRRHFELWFSKRKPVGLQSVARQQATLVGDLLKLRDLAATADEHSLSCSTLVGRY